MKIKSILIKNFKSIGNNGFTYRFDDEYTLIKGAPGKGKTLILTSIVFNLFGKNSDFKGNSNSTLPVNKLINDMNNKELYTELELDNGYKIIRGLKPNIFEVINPKGVNINDASAKKLDQEMLEQDILKGLDLNLFMTTNYLCSKPSSVPFLYMSKTQRKEYIEKMLDLRIVYHLNENLKPHIAENKLDKSKFDSEMKILNQTIDNEVFNIQEGEKRYKEQELKLKDFEENKTNRIKNLENDILSLHKIILSTQEQLESLNLDKDICKDKKLPHDSLKLDLNRNTLNEKITIKNKLKEEVLKQQTEKSVYTKNKENYFMCGDCPTLSKIVGVFDEDNYNTFLVKTAEVFQNLDKEIESISKDIEYIERIKINNDSVDAEIRNIEQEIKSLDYEISLKNSEMTSKSKMIESINNEVPPVLTPVSTDYLKKLQNSKIALQTKLDDNYNQNIDLDKMKKEINDKEHKAKALKSYLPLFENKLNELLERFFVNMEFNIKAKLEDDFELTFYKNNKAVDIFGMSGGQKQLIALSVTFAFLHLLDVKHQNSFKHLFIDEILDMSLGVELPNVLEYLKELSQEKCIDLISHNTSINEEMFDKVVIVVKDGQFSKYIIE